MAHRSIFFTKLSEAVQQHLHPTLITLGIAEVESKRAWYGGGISLARSNVRLDISYDIHDTGLQVSLGTPTRDPIPDYSLYTIALGIPTEEFVEACGGWRPGFFKVPDLESALAFVALTLPQVLPQQTKIQDALQGSPEKSRKRPPR